MASSDLKHSSGDLQSRLKTRKVLGVGEIDDGDVHRSKISQILGHSEHLYRKLPRGLWYWQLLEAILFTATALLCILFPNTLYDIAFTVEMGPGKIASTRMYGVAMLSYSVMWWNVVFNPLCSTERSLVRMCLLISTIFHVSFDIAVLVTLVQGGMDGWVCPVLTILLRGCFAFISASYYYAIDHPNFSPFWGLLTQATALHGRSQTISKSPSSSDLSQGKASGGNESPNHSAAKPDALKKTE